MPDTRRDVDDWVGKTEGYIEFRWDEAGKDFLASNGLDPEAWQVKNPEVARSIRSATLDFCAATNKTSHLRAEEAREAARQALLDGMDAGDNLDQLRKRIRGIFHDDARAERIARTESMRGHHAGQVAAGNASGVVAGWKWLASSDACPQCLALADKVMAPDRAFAIVSDHPSYGAVKYPPLHPNCSCSIAPVIDEARLIGARRPEPVQVPVPVPPATPAPKPKPARKPRAPKWKEPILRGRPMDERLDAYTEGDRKVKEIQEAGKEHAARIAEIIPELNAAVKEMESLSDQAARRTLTQEEIDRWKALSAKARSLNDERHHLEVVAPRERVRQILATDAPAALKVKETLAFDGDSYEPPSKHQRAEMASALEWLSGVLRTDGRQGPIEVKFGAIPASKEQRDYQKSGFIAASKGTTAKVMIHELGHAIDTLVKDGNPDPIRANRVLDASQAFLKYRVGNEPLQQLQALMPTRNYRPEEKGRKDDFDRYFSMGGAYYCGKDYGTYGTEILSMGLEALYHDPVGFATKDPEFAKYVIGILDGSLR